MSFICYLCSILADKAKAKVDYWQAVEDERQRNSFAKP
jgi:hypothetical protein